jgi:ABC-type oligopeptide transport system substrate-binding subunit
MKKAFLLVLALVLTLSLAACGGKDTGTAGSDDPLNRPGGDWPDNEFTRLLPKPELGVSLAAVTGNSFQAILAATMEAGQLVSAVL